MTAVLFLASAVISSAVYAEEAGYTEKTVKVFSGGEEQGSLALRFYDETPNVAYIGMREYSGYMRQQPFEMRGNEDGTCTLLNWNGAELFCDAQAGVITVPDWNEFLALPMPLEDRALGMKDTTVHFIRMTEVSYEGEPEPLVLDFAKYGISVHTDENDIYLPVSVVSNIMTDIATNYMLYNGENLYVQRLSLEGGGTEGFYDSEFLKAQFQGGMRPEDVIKECYADLCFNFDHFFGHPGKAPLDAAIAEKGLDQAIDELGEEGEEIKDGMFSAEMGDYLSALSKLFYIGLSDGHTTFFSSQGLLNAPAVKENPELASRLSASSIGDLLRSEMSLKQTRNLLIPMQRSMVWGDESYREYGSTAIIRLDSFMPDEYGWDSYYKGESDTIPEDALGNVVLGLRKASENPDIKNVIIDLTGNSGGSPDVMMAILAMTTGQDQLYGKNVITGQDMTVTFETDSNFDGVYDEQDKEVRYDFNYGVLVSRHAFSCGNLFPFIIKEAGAVLIGEPSSGGSCCVQMGSDAEGLCYTMSSGQWLLTDSQGNNVEGGCPIDLPITPESNELIDGLASLIGLDDGIPGYMDYYDDEMLDNMMNEWFAGQEELAPAA